MRTVFILLLISIIISCKEQRADLSLRLETGKEYRQNMNMKSTAVQEVEGQTINMEISAKAVMTYLVKSIDERGYVLDVKYESLAMDMQTPYGPFVASSEDNESGNMFSAVLGAMKNKPFEVVMAKTGKVLEVNNIENLFDSAMASFDHIQMSEEQREQAKAQVMKAYGAEAFKGSTEMVTAIFPENPVNKGDKWNVKTNMESGMSAKIITDYEFSDQTSDYAIIKGNSTIKTEDKDAYIKSDGMPTRYDLKGSMQSEIKVDKKTGWIIEAKINQELYGDAYIKENPQMPSGMKFPMYMTNKVSITN